jgi:hypothetical protein
MFLKGETGRSGELWPAETSSATTSLRRMLVRLPSLDRLLSCIIDAEEKQDVAVIDIRTRLYRRAVKDREGYDFHQIRV